jgi:beta-glucanase (GH16 family)
MKQIILASVLFYSISAYCGLGVNSGFHYKTSYHDYTDTYGRWEVRSKLVPHHGLATGFCLLHDCNNNPDSAETMWAEIDIEVTGLEADKIQSVAHIYNNQTFFQRPYCVQYFYYYEGYYEQYHTYTIEWTPYYVAWELDGLPYRVAAAVDGGTRDICYAMYDDGDVRAGDVVRDTTYELEWVVEYRTKPMRFAFDTWICRDTTWCPGWAGEFDSADFSGNAIFYSWFKKYDYTPGEGPDNTNFTMVDYDDFTADSIDFDTTIWAAAYDVFMKEGKAVAKLQWPFTGEIPEDDGDTAASEPSPLNDYSSYAKGTGHISSSRNGESVAFSAEKIAYIIDRPGNIKIYVHNAEGRLVKKIADNYATAGSHSLTPDMSSVANGVYVLTLNTPSGRLLKGLITKAK